ncbi:MAG: ATP-dependent DNA helicase, partial [Ramlibacter sp.]
PDKACHGESCPLARGFYDRLPAARSAALGHGVGQRAMDRPALRTLALEHGVCPYYLGQELVRWADVVVGDYNYYFDASALLHGLTAANEWRVAVLADEAHNLVERARGMYSALLDPQDLRAVRRTAPAGLKKPLDKLHRCWNGIQAGQQEPYATREAIPPKFMLALQQASAAIADHLADALEPADGPLQQFHFSLLGFTRLAESFGDHSLFDVSLQPRGPGRKPDAVLCIRNLIPAPFLAPRFAAAHSVALFSATLSPRHFYRDMLGLPENTAWIDVASPFAQKQLAVQLVRNISTRFTDRQGSAMPIARLIGAQFAQQPGNYLAFFSSFDYLQMVLSAFTALHPEVPVWQQSRRMPEAQRSAFLERFVPAGAGVGFAVLGGSFAEGIDLPGDRLVGAFIATLGLPQVNSVNEQMKQRMEAAFGAGYDYTYLFPGLQKVVQAAGRVIRTEEDRGMVMLIDDRFGRPAVRSLLPAWWGL